MNRLDHRHIAARVSLSSAVVDEERPPEVSRWRLTPAMQGCVGVLAFVCCGAAIVAAAGLLALQIH